MDEKQTTIEVAKQIIHDLMDRGFIITIEGENLRVRPDSKLLYKDRLRLKVYQRSILQYWQQLQEAEGIESNVNETEQATDLPAITHYLPGRILRGPALYPSTQ